MQSDLDQYGISIYALSKDSVDETKIHKERDNLSLTLLSDERLDIIRQFGVEHHKAFGFNTSSFMIFGIPLGFKPSFEAMAIPTTMLIDEDGVIRWIDQADDYRIRSNNDRVMAAIKNVFG